MKRRILILYAKMFLKHQFKKWYKKRVFKREPSYKIEHIDDYVFLYGAYTETLDQTGCRMYAMYYLPDFYWDTLNKLEYQSFKKYAKTGQTVFYQRRSRCCMTMPWAETSIQRVEILDPTVVDIEELDSMPDAKIDFTDEKIYGLV